MFIGDFMNSRYEERGKKKPSAEGLNPEVKMATGKEGWNQTNLEAWLQLIETKQSKTNKQKKTPNYFTS